MHDIVSSLTHGNLTRQPEPLQQQSQAQHQSQASTRQRKSFFNFGLNN